MRALVIERPGLAAVHAVPDPTPEPGEVVVAVARVGLCGTDAELFDGRLAARLVSVIEYPMTPGHEWSGTIVAVGRNVDSARLGEHVIGDTFIGCGRCRECRVTGAPTCAARQEIGVRGRAGAAAEYVSVPTRNARRIAPEVLLESAVFSEPLSNAVRAVSEARLPQAGAVALIRGAGTLGILAARLVDHAGGRAIVLDSDHRAVERAAELGIEAVHDRPDERVDAVIDMSPAEEFDSIVPLLRNGGTLVVTGFPDPIAAVRVRDIVDRDLRLVGTLGAARHLDRAINLIECGAVRVDDLAGKPLLLEAVGDALRSREFPEQPKVQVDPCA